MDMVYDAGVDTYHTMAEAAGGAVGSATGTAAEGAGMARGGGRFRIGGADGSGGY